MSSVLEGTRLREGTGVPSKSSGRSWLGLVWTLVRTDFKARYHGTLSGFVWALLKPLSMFVVLVTVFALVFAAEENYRLNLIVGLFIWDFFAEGTRTGLTSLHARAYLLTRARCPSWVLVVSSMSNPLLTLGVFSVAMTVFLSLAGRPPSAANLGLFVFYLLHLVAIVAGLALATSVLFLRYRDLNQVWDVAMQAGFFVAPIIYPIGVLPERVHFFLYLWFPTPIIEFARAVIVARTVPTPTAHVYLFLEAVIVLAGGIAVYRALAPRAAEYL